MPYIMGPDTEPLDNKIRNLEQFAGKGDGQGVTAMKGRSVKGIFNRDGRRTGPAMGRVARVAWVTGSQSRNPNGSEDSAAPRRGGSGSRFFEEPP